MQKILELLKRILGKPCAIIKKYNPFKKLFALIEERLTERQKRGLQIILDFSKLGLYAMIGMLALYALAQGIFGAGIFVPKDGKGVLNSVKDPKNLISRTEIIREKTIYGSKIRQDVLRVTKYDFERQRTLTTARGYTANQIEMQSEKTRFLMRFGRQDFKEFKEPLDFNSIRPATGKELAKMSPEIVTDKATLVGKRTWSISFKPTGALIQRLLWVKPLQITGEDQDAIAAGQFDLEYARAWVERGSRQLLLVDMTFTAKNTKYRILAHYRDINNTPLKNPV